MIMVTVCLRLRDTRSLWNKMADTAGRMDTCYDNRAHNDTVGWNLYIEAGSW